MKSIYATLSALALMSIAGAVFAQSGTNQIPVIETQELMPANMLNPTPEKPSSTGSERGETITYFSEDFSNGFDGQGANGAWTTEGPNGNLWFYALPQGTPGGYDGSSPLAGLEDAYGEFIPNWWGGSETINSANGFMMLDADRYNSTATVPGETGSDNTISNPIDASLVSPVMNLSAAEGEGLFISFTQNFRVNSPTPVLTFGVSTNGGLDYVNYDYWALSGATINNGQTGTGTIDISVQTQNAPDLSQVRVKVTWGSLRYHFQIDDIAIVQAPQNELVIGRTFLNNYFDYQGDDEDMEFVKRFSYWNQPQYITRPFNFAAEVTNNGSMAQTEVKLRVTFDPPGAGTNEIFESEPITLDAGMMDTLRILDVIPDSWAYPAAAGTYTSSFEIVQAEEDLFPDNNIGTARTTRISLDTPNPAIFQNDRNVISGLPFPADAQDHIHGARFVFTEPEEANKVITHIEFVLITSGTSVTQPGELLFLNVRTGSVFEPESATNVIERLFGDDEIEHTIQASDISTTGTPTWISIELPTPLLIEPDMIYQGEVEIPAAGVPIAFIALSNDNEIGSSAILDLADQAGGWVTFGNNIATMIRFRTQGTVLSTKVSYESGIKLTQNYPNPFVDQTTIQYQLDEAGEASLEVFDITGKLMVAKNLGFVPAGQVNFYTLDRQGLAAGTYTYSIVTENSRVTRKMIID